MTQEFPTKRPKCSFNIVNIQEQNRNIVGQFDCKSLQITSPIIFPSGTLEVPKNTRSELLLSFHDGTFNIHGVESEQNRQLYIGAYYGVEFVNNSTTVLENFDITYNHFNCGVSRFDFEHFYNCFQARLDDFGLAFFGTLSSAVSAGTHDVFQALGLDIPIIGSQNEGDFLKDKERYPNYMRTVIGDGFTISIYAQIMRVFKWTYVSGYFIDDGWGTGGMNIFVEEAERRGMIIVNPEDKRQYSSSFTLDMAGDISNYFDETKAMGVRPMIIASFTDYFAAFVENLYDQGFRRNDLVLFHLSIWIDSFMVSLSTQQNKFFELIQSSFTFYVSSYYKQFGEELYQKFIDRYGYQTDSWCFYFDSVLLVSSTLDWMLRRGENFGDGKLLNQFIRNNRIVGCSGNVYIDPELNDRSAETFNIFNTQLIQEEPPMYEGLIVGVYAPSSSVLIQLKSDIIWPDGTNVPPSDVKIVTFKCAYPKEDLETQQIGLIIGIAACGGVILITVVVTIIIFRRHKETLKDEMKEKQETSLDDIAQIAIVGVDVFQLAAMGPGFQSIGVIGMLTSASVLAMDEVLPDSDGLQWIIIYITLVVTFLQITFCLFLHFKINERYSSNPIISSLEGVAIRGGPFFANFLFLPITLKLLNLFVCYEGIKNELSYTVFDKDCEQVCWQDKHFTTVVLGSILLLLHAVIATFMRPDLQDAQVYLHIHTQPKYNIIKSLVQVVAVSLHLTVKKISEGVEGILFLIIIALLLMYQYKYKPYTYSRLSMWNTVALLGLLWFSLLGTLFSFVEGELILWVILLLIGLAVLGLGGLVVQLKKHPSFLETAKGHDIANLFKFQLTPGATPQQFGLVESKYAILD